MIQHGLHFQRNRHAGAIDLGQDVAGKVLISAYCAAEMLSGVPNRASPLQCDRQDGSLTARSMSPE